MTVKHLLDKINDLEWTANLDLDAVMHKATQEHGEFIESLGQGDSEHIIDEASDVVSNLLSASHRIGVDTDQLVTENNTDIDLTPLFSQRNDQVQTLRNIYTRNNKETSMDQLTKTTSSYVAGVLNALDNKVDLTQLLQHSIQKMSGRMDMYEHPLKLEDYILNVPDYPKEGIQFKDITTLLSDPEAFKVCIDRLTSLSRDADVIVGLDARGFIFGSTVAYKLGIPFVPARKPGKLPRETVDVSYELEYGTNALSLHTDSIMPGDKVVIIDDLLATGGSALAAKQLIEALKGNLIGANFVIELDGLLGREKLESTLVSSLIHYE